MGEFEPDNMNPLFPRGPSLGVKLGLFVLLSLAMMFADHRLQLLDDTRGLIATAIEPLHMLADLPQQVAGVADYFSSHGTLLNENQALRRERLLLEAELQKLAALQAENHRIRALLESAQVLDEKVVIAEISATSTDPYRHLIRLSKGSLDGVFVGQSLIDAHGIVGQVVNVTPVSANAILITDVNHGIPVEIGRTGLQTVAHGDGDMNLLRLPYLPGNSDVQVGDLLVSSGLGGRYPAGYPVGTVTRVDHPPGAHFLDIIASPAARLQHGREVLLVWQRPKDPGITDIAAAADSKPTGSASEPSTRQ